MQIAIRYYTKSGNTKTLAEAIAKELNLEAKSVDTPLEERVDLLFLGSSVYAAGIDPAVKKFLSNNREKIGKIVNFSTAALLPSTYKQVKGLANKYDIPMAEEEFHCKGSFLSLHKGRPNAKDCEDVALFAKKVLSQN